MGGWGADKTFKATFFRCYFFIVETFPTGINNRPGLFLPFSLYRQEKGNFIHYWNVTALSFCCYFFFVFLLFNSLNNATAVNKQAELCGCSGFCCTPKSRLGPFHFLSTPGCLAKSGGWFTIAGLLKACLQCRLIMYTQKKKKKKRKLVRPTTFLLAKYFLPREWIMSWIWCCWLVAVFSHADCTPDKASTAGEDPSGFATVSVSNWCYLLIGFQHVAPLLYSATVPVCFVSFTALSEDTEVSVFKITSRANLCWCFFFFFF